MPAPLAAIPPLLAAGARLFVGVLGRASSTATRVLPKVDVRHELNTIGVAGTVVAATGLTVYNNHQADLRETRQREHQNQLALNEERRHQETQAALARIAAGSTDDHARTRGMLSEHHRARERAEQAMVTALGKISQDVKNVDRKIGLLVTGPQRVADDAMSFEERAQPLVATGPALVFAPRF